jgi:hypothetical protein
MPVGEITAGPKVGDSGVKAVGWLRGRLARRRAEQEQLRQAKEHLEVDELLLALDDGMVLVGSPEAEGVARLAYGYRRREDGLGMAHVDPPVDLPFRWEEDGSQIEAVYHRFVEGRGLVARPNWPIVDQRGAERRLFPRVGNDGLLQSDYLLVTKVPNYLTRTGFESGRSLITFAGSHGTGTRAVELLMRDRAALRRVAEELTPDVHAFQLLFEVGDMLHDSTEGTKARAIRLVACSPLDRPDAVWEEARRAVQSRLPGWCDEMERAPS